MTNKNKYIQGNKKSKKNLILISIGVLSPILLAYLFLTYYYSNHFYSNTVINGVSASNMTVEQAEVAINEQVNSYVLSLDGRNNVTDTIHGISIDLHTVYGKSLSELLDEQNSFAWPLSLLQPHDLEVDTMIEYDEALLDKIIDKLKFFDAANIVEPKNASISEYGENGYEIVPADPGAKIDKDLLKDIIKESITSLPTNIILDATGAYVEPEITSENPELVKALDEMNRIAATKITYQFGDVTEILDGSKISKWLSMDENYNISLNEDGIKEYVDYIGKNYNSFGRVRTFKTSYGETIQVSGGDYGWWLDRVTERADLKVLILDGAQINREPAYFQTAQQYGQDDIGNTYVEVNLTAQHLFFYKEGELILETDFVSGNIAKDYGTPVGTYPVQYKENDATLTGEDYSTPVKYWMPFNRNIGFHDAPWRKKFGQDIYKTNGSHGCINMPPAAAKIMFENIKRGVAVVVYELKGTEPKKTDEKTDVAKKTNKR